VPEAVTKESLTAAINLADSTKLLFVVSSANEVPLGEKFVTGDAYNALQTVIERAELVRDDSAATQTAVNMARDALLQAIKDFQTSISLGTNPDLGVTDKSVLLETINKARDAKVNVFTSPTTSTGTYWVTQAVSSTFDDAIAAASSVAMTPRSTQTQVDAKVETLEKAITTFEQARASPVTVNFTDIAAPPVENGTSRRLDLQFSANIIDLSSSDITLRENNVDVNYLKSGQVTQGSVAGTYSQTIQGLTAGKTITVSVTKPGYVISEELTVTLSYATLVNFMNVTPYSSGGTTTSALNIQFDRTITDLVANDIFIEDATSGLEIGNVDKGAAFDSTGGGIYKLSVKPNGNTAVTVRPVKTGVVFVPASINVNLDYAANASFNSAFTTELNGTTTSITLAFSKNIDGLDASHITLVDEALGNAAKNGALIAKDTGVGLYELPITTSRAGALRVMVAKSGTNFTVSEQIVTLAKANEANVSVSAVSAASGKTESILLYFTNSGGSGISIDGITENEITITGPDGILKGVLTEGPVEDGYYTLPISGFASSGSATVSIAKSGWNFNIAAPSVSITYSTSASFYLASPVNNENGITTKLALYLSQDITGLNEAGISIVKKQGSGTIEINSFAHISLGLYEIGVSGFDETTAVTVTIGAIGSYYFTNSSCDATLSYPIRISIAPNRGILGSPFTAGNSVYSVILPTQSITVEFTASANPSGADVSYATGASGGEYTDAKPQVTLDATTNSIVFRVKASLSGGVEQIFGPYTFNLIPFCIVSGLAYEVFSDADYEGIKFTGGNGTVAFSMTKTIDFLVVGGGGGGGSGWSSDSGGGGGAGGYVDKTNFTAIANVYTLTVGSGGNGGAGLSSAGLGNRGAAGTASVFWLAAQGVTDGLSNYGARATGGGIGAKGGYGAANSDSGCIGGNGGSGGGGGAGWGDEFGIGGTKTGGTVIGYNGANGTGGAGGKGGGAGGDSTDNSKGLSNSITGSPYMYSKGGAGQGGANGVNYGDGGGGCANGAAGKGAGGVVIIRWAK
jgi:hypothetical protein